MANNNVEFLKAIEEIETIKGISKDVVIATLKEALARGFRKQLGGDDALVRVDIDPDTGKIEMYQIKNVVEEVEDDFLEISVEDANKDGGHYVAGDEYLIPASIEDLRKATALSVKSILRQKFAEAERGALYEAFKDKIGTMITGKVEKVDDRGCSVNIGKTSVYLNRKEMIGDERFAVGDNIKLYVSDVASGSHGAHIVVSRANEGFLSCLFNEEIHEIYDGTIIIKAIARQAGERSKVSVYSNDPNVDPAGACIGPNGSRIQKIVSQLGNGSNKEKIDVITYSSNLGLYLMEAVKPAKVLGIILSDNPEVDKEATLIVSDDSLSTAIGRKGVNVRLASRLTNYKLNIIVESEAIEEGLTYTSFEELQAKDVEERIQKADLELQRKEAEETSTDDVLPGLPEGYVAPQARVYEDESNDFDEALSEAVEEEDETPVVETPVEEEKPAPAPKKEEEVETVQVNINTDTSIEDLERSLEEENARNKNNNNKKTRKNKKKVEDEEEEDSSSSSIHSEPANYMPIYTEEELEELDEDEDSDYDDDEDVDYDQYDEYYDDDK